MKKQIKPALPVGRKLHLSKRTIANLNSSEMSRVVGGKTGTCFHPCPGGGGNSKNCTVNQNTCPGHATCYTC
jgi:natural product precursor